MTLGTLARPTDDADKDDGNYIVPGLERGLKILAEFSPREPVLGAPELSKRLKIPRTTVLEIKSNVVFGKFGLIRRQAVAEPVCCLSPVVRL